MKRIVSLVLAFLVLLLALPVRAEEETEQERLDRSRIRWSMAMTADMAGNALDRRQEAGEGEERQALERFAQVDYLAPDRAVVLEFDKVQSGRAERALETSGNGWDEVGPALADRFNVQFSEAYASAARLARAEGETTVEYSKYFTLILLCYGSEISATALTAYGSVNSQSAFILSTPGISAALGEAEVEKTVGELGLEMPLVRIYGREDLEALLTRKPWGQDSCANKLTDAVLASAARQEKLLPALLYSDSVYLNDSLKDSVLIIRLNRMEDADQKAVLETAQAWRTLGEGKENAKETFLNCFDQATGGAAVPVEVVYGEETAEGDLKEDGTYLILFEKQIPEREMTAWYDLTLEAALPVRNIPEKAEEADYIIRCSTDYSGGVSSGGAHLHYPRTRIAVYDAQTGEQRMDLGTVTRKLTGVMMIGKGDTWWDPLRTMIWEQISVLFPEEP